MMITILFWALFVVMSWKHEQEFAQMTFGAPAAEAPAVVVPAPCPVDAKKRRLRCPE